MAWCHVDMHSVLAAGLSTQISTWLDEEWTPLEVHERLGKAAANAYCTARYSRYS